MEQKISPLQKASLYLAGALIIGLISLPYGFYIILRLATAIIMSCWAFKFFDQEKLTLAVISGSIALLFQPVFPIKLDKFTWHIVDIVLVIYLVVIVLKYNYINNENE